MKAQTDVAQTLVATDYKDPQIVCRYVGNIADHVTPKGTTEETAYTLTQMDSVVVTQNE